MTLHRHSRSTFDGLAVVAIAGAFLAAAPIGAASAAGVGVGPAGASASASSGQGSNSNGSGYVASETDCVTVAQQPARYAPDELAACGIVAPMGGYGYDPTGAYGYVPGRG